MIERPFTHHRAAALVLLNPSMLLTRKAGSFRGPLVVDAMPIRAAQRDWLGKLLERPGARS